jgi:serine protease Do
VPSETVKAFLAKRAAYAFDPRNPNTGYHYLNPPRKHPATLSEVPTESSP